MITLYLLCYFRSSDGLLLLSAGDSLTDFLAISLVRGNVSLLFENLGGSQRATSAVPYNEKQVHTLQFTFNNSHFSFIIDGNEQPSIVGIPGT